MVNRGGVPQGFVGKGVWMTETPTTAGASLAQSQEAVNLRTEPVCIGIDVGSTTVKAAVVDPVTHEILWADYQRHQTKQAEKVLEMLVAIGAAFPRLGERPGLVRTFITGSGAGPLVAPLGSKFVQEVNAVTLAVEKLHPDVSSAGKTRRSSSSRRRRTTPDSRPARPPSPR